uniref:Uncharacterized protein n=1 Tax=Eutreptiella gymnastica TaxID=73025 RepID=A0A7S1I3S4_9EUGL
MIKAKVQEIQGCRCIPVLCILGRQTRVDYREETNDTVVPPTPPSGVYTTPCAHHASSWHASGAVRMVVSEVLNVQCPTAMPQNAFTNLRTAGSLIKFVSPLGTHCLWLL